VCLKCINDQSGTGKAFDDVYEFSLAVGKFLNFLHVLMKLKNLLSIALIFDIYVIIIFYSVPGTCL